MPIRCLFKQKILTNFNKNKKRVNKFTKLDLDPIISSSDWIIYDDESLNFLMNLENTAFDPPKNIKYEENKIFLTDKLPYLTLNSREYRQILVEIDIPDCLKTLIDCSLETKVTQIVETINKHLKKLKKPLLVEGEFYLKATKLQFSFKKRLHLGL